MIEVGPEIEQNTVASNSAAAAARFPSVHGRSTTCPSRPKNRAKMRASGPHRRQGGPNDAHGCAEARQSKPKTAQGRRAGTEGEPKDGAPGGACALGGSWRFASATPRPSLALSPWPSLSISSPSPSLSSPPRGSGPVKSQRRCRREGRAGAGPVVSRIRAGQPTDPRGRWAWQGGEGRGRVLRREPAERGAAAELQHPRRCGPPR